MGFAFAAPPQFYAVCFTWSVVREGAGSGIIMPPRGSMISHSVFWELDVFGRAVVRLMARGHRATAVMIISGLGLLPSALAQWT